MLGVQNMIYQIRLLSKPLFLYIASMTKHIFSIITVVSLIAAMLSASQEVDYKAARNLERQLRGTVANTTIAPQWSQDKASLCYQVKDQIFEVMAATGQKRTVAFADSLAKLFNNTPPIIHRFRLNNTGEFFCLAGAGNTVKTLLITNNKITSVAKDADPFIIIPQVITPDIRSSRSRAASKIVFINDTAESVDILWIDPSKQREKYASLKPGEAHIQGTYVGHAFIAGDLVFFAEKETAVAYISSKPLPQNESTTTEAAQEWSAAIKQNNLYVKSRDSNKEVQLTNDGSKKWSYSAPFLWSPDRRYLVVSRIKEGTRRTIDLIHSAPSDQLQPKTESILYEKPGDTLDVAMPHLFDLKDAKEILLDQSLYANPFNLLHWQWSADGNRLFFVYNERGHQTLRLLAIDASTGAVKTIIEERSKTFIDYAYKTYVHHLEATDEVIWMSERSGWNHLYLINRSNGQSHSITLGEWVVRDVEHVDADKRQIYFRASGIRPGQDPYYIHYARINFDGTGLVILTEANGTHALQFSYDMQYFTDTWSRVDQPPVHELRRSSDGKLIVELGRAEIQQLLKVHPHLPEPFVAKARDGATDIYGVIYRPTYFDPKLSYPVLESIYAGPHGYNVPKGFTPFRNEQMLAELGFIVVMIDGMGTNWRSKSFHDICWKNLKDAGFPDRIVWIKAAGSKYPWMDLARVGIVGGSAGGQNAMRAVIDHADFYKAAAADCGCHDNRMDKIWWNEAWMGWPVDESYAKNSNAVDAHRLNGKLLLTVGLLDSNVDPSSTWQVVDALIKADKDFELIAFPNSGHSAAGTPYGMRKTQEFFVRHLIERK